MPEVSRSQRTFWLVVAAGMIIVGSLATIFGADVITRNDNQSSRQTFNTSSQQIASSLEVSIKNEENLVVNAGAFFIGTPGPTFNGTPGPTLKGTAVAIASGTPNSTQPEFLKWLVATQTFVRYPELEGIAEVVVVPASQLSTFETEAKANPAGTLGPGRTFQVTPSGNRSYYCFARVAESRNGTSTQSAGLDYCDTVLGAQFLRAEDSGEGSYVPFGSGAGEELVVGTPIYSTGFVPKTEQARKAAFVGWIGTQVYPRVILASALEDHPKTSVAFTYALGATKVSFKSGAVPRGAQSKTIQLQKGWRVEVYAKLTGGGVFDNTNALTLLITGILLSLLLGILTFVLATGRSRALAMVHERTDQLQHQALHDSLTGLPNRALILDRIDQMLSRARRDNVAIAVLFLDLDNFKDINDTLGHAAGDQLLVKVAARLANVLRKADTVGRLGGDEFVILAEGASLAPGAEAVADRILEMLKAPFEIEASDVPLNVTSSIGIAEGLREKPDDMLRDADIALYQAKSAGKHCAVVFQPSMQKAVDEHRSLTLDLSVGVELHQFFLLYEPTINLATGAFTGVEAQLRWRHPTRGVVKPDGFMPSLEASGLVVPVGLWALQEACRQGAKWHSEGHRFAVSVNVTPKQLVRDRIIDEVRDALAESGFDAESLILEIGETSLMYDVDATITRLEALKGLGVHLAVDDFGTWYSSLAFLQRFPIDILKIDRSFVSGIGDTKEASALVHTLVQLGIALGLETIAEGVENREQRRLLLAENVDSGQGFLFAQPLDVGAIDQLLNDWGGGTDEV
jgi:diguanylate cyclase (GGDEF)-like protein